MKKKFVPFPCCKFLSLKALQNFIIQLAEILKLDKKITRSWNVHDQAEKCLIFFNMSKIASLERSG